MSEVSEVAASILIDTMPAVAARASAAAAGYEAALTRIADEESGQWGHIAHRALREFQGWRDAPRPPARDDAHLAI